MTPLNSIIVNVNNVSVNKKERIFLWSEYGLESPCYNVFFVFFHFKTNTESHVSAWKSNRMRAPGYAE